MDANAYPYDFRISYCTVAAAVHPGIIFKVYSTDESLSNGHAFGATASSTPNPREAVD